MTRTSSVEKKSWEKWCLRNRLGSWKPSDGEKRAENGSETVNQVHLQDQGGFTPPLCPQGLALPQHCIMFTDTMKGREVWWKFTIWLWNMEDVTISECRTFFWIRDPGFFCLSSACQKRCRDERLWQEPQKCRTEAMQGGDPAPSTPLYYFGCIWRKQGSRTVCFAPFKAIQISSAMETAGILSLPFFTGSSTESGAFACEMTALSFHLGASCLTKLIENITPLWPKNESLGEQRHPAVKNEHWKQWSCQFSYQDANKYRGCQAGGSAGPLV